MNGGDRKPLRTRVNSAVWNECQTGNVQTLYGLEPFGPIVKRRSAGQSSSPKGIP
jgi:hypothetical protein